jgi:DNA-binding LacI/PurR family transcriptional regulator
LAVSTADVDLQQGRPAQLWQLLGFTDAAGNHGYRVVLMASHASNPCQDEFEAMIRSNACDGFLLWAEQLTPDLRRLLLYHETPFVVLGDPGDEAIPQVDIDNYAYTYQSIEWLVKQGHRRIAIAEFADVRFGVDVPHIQKIRSAYFDAMRNLCGVQKEEWAPRSRSRHSSDRMNLLRGDDAPTAVVVPSVQDAYIWEATLRMNGLRIPDDLTLLCHLPSMEAIYVEPGIAYHAHDLRAMGMRAGELLIEWIESGTAPARRLLVPAMEPVWKELAAENDINQHQSDIASTNGGISRDSSLF